MIKTILKILGILALAIFQLSFFSKIAFLGSIPNVILILAIAFVIKNRLADAILIAAVGGIFLDFVSPMHFGVFTFLFMAIILLINFVLLRIIPAPRNLIAFFIFLGSFLFLDLMIFLIIKVVPAWQILISSFIEAIWAILIYFLISKEISQDEEIKLV